MGFSGGDGEGGGVGEDLGVLAAEGEADFGEAELVNKSEICWGNSGRAFYIETDGHPHATNGRLERR